ncbi:aldo/keto reductase [Brevibacterium sp. 5221]|uniref:Aldo/keto reductase n=1 Tax=Brevibacterium rongguiense TaxID=2695267 RepID=A0A6N9H737_9MICO|nr:MULTISPECIES: aldo/keto reductase [Brevibacterium]MYM19394.1 aldo/keto reductase [Brevibacterium rongguiense]WAL39310.1 aldo/keto reductase [Brevibacterium sp. BRM-1]
MTTEHTARIPRTDIEVFRLNLGGNVFGWTADREESFAVLDAFADRGGDFVDTADVYSAWGEGHTGGESEDIIGQWFERTGRRDETVIATKVGSWDQRPGLSPANVAAALDDSLRRLRTDRVDLYYAHRDDEETSAEDLAAGFDAVVRSGKARAIGMSNLSPERQRAWLEAARANGLAAPVAIQPQHSLVHRAAVEGTPGHPEDGYGALAREYDLAVFPYFALAAGFLTGKYRSAADVGSGARSAAVGGYATPAGFAVVDELLAVAAEVGAPPASVAIAWLLAKGATAPIASARTVEQLDPLFAAVDLALDAEQVARLDRASAPYLRE